MEGNFCFQSAFIEMQFTVQFDSNFIKKNTKCTVC